MIQNVKRESFNDQNTSIIEFGHKSQITLQFIYEIALEVGSFIFWISLKYTSESYLENLKKRYTVGQFFFFPQPHFLAIHCGLLYGRSETKTSLKGTPLKFMFLRNSLSNSHEKIKIPFQLNLKKN